MTSITVAICTLDRTDSLRRALLSLAAQATDRAFNVLVLDNSPNQSGLGVFDEFADRLGAGAEYVAVDELGLSVARNVALQRASTQYVAFVDDDVTVPETWLEELGSGLDAPGIAVAGGPIRLAWETRRPGWMLPEHEGFYSGLDLGAETRDFRIPPETPYGTNLIVDRLLALEHGGFDESLGRVGSGLVGAEDMDIALRLAPFGAVRYVAPAWLFHHVEPHRATRRWLLRRYFSQGKTAALMAAVERPAIGDAAIERRGWSSRLRPRPIGRYVRFLRLLPYMTAEKLGSAAQHRQARSAGQ